MPKKFKRINIEISSACNLSCSFCCGGKKLNRAKTFMDIALFDRILKQAVPITEIVSVHLMGEPLMHPEFSSILRVAEKQSAKIDLTTNGTLIEKWGPFFESPSIRQINFSLQGAIDHFQSKIDSEGFEKYFESVISLAEYASQKRPDIFINFRLWNLKSSFRIDKASYELVKKILKRFHSDILPKDDEDFLQMKSVRVTGKIFLHFESLFEWPTINLPVIHENGFCHGLSSHFGILSDGRVVPCCLDRDGIMILGDASTETIPDILKKPRAIAIKEGFKKKRLIEDLCKTCSYIKRFNLA